MPRVVVLAGSLLDFISLIIKISLTHALRSTSSLRSANHPTVHPCAAPIPIVVVDLLPVIPKRI